MNNTQEILKRVDAISSKLGVVADQVISVYQRQAQVEAYTDLFWGSFLFLLVFWFGYITYKLIKDEDDDEAVPSGIATLVSFVFGLFFINSSFTEFFNPQYWAIHKIMEDFVK